MSVNRVETELKKFGKYIEKQAKTNLTKKGKKDTGDLYKSIRFDVKASKNSFEFSFYGTEYFDFVDKGVKGVSSSAKAPKSPYKFGSGTGNKNGLTNGINNWVERKRIQFRTKEGKFMSYKSTAFLIKRSIWFKGLETTNFFSRPFELAFNRLPDDLVEAYALEVEDLLNFTRK